MVTLCTDSQEIKSALQSWDLADQVPVLLTSAACSSRSDRIASVLPQLIKLSSANLAAKNLEIDKLWILNVQGDQPCLDPAVVKCLLASSGQCLTFSRSAIPHMRDCMT